MRVRGKGGLGVRWVAVACLLATLDCTVTHVPPSGTPPPTASPSPSQPTPADHDPLAVEPEPDSLTIVAWAEPPHLPPGGGQAQILVRVQRPGGGPAVGVEVRLGTSKGRLYSRGRILRTDSQGRTRDRLTTRRTAVVTLNAGGTRYSFVVPVLPRQAGQSQPGAMVGGSEAPARVVQWRPRMVPDPRTR